MGSVLCLCCSNTVGTVRWARTDFVAANRPTSRGPHRPASLMARTQMSSAVSTPPYERTTTMRVLQALVSMSLADVLDDAVPPATP